MDDDESLHDNGMLMLQAFLTYAENGVAPADYILEHFATCFRKILKEGTYTFDEEADEHPQFAYKLDPKAMGTLVREALCITRPYTSDKHWNDAQWFYSLDEEVTKRRQVNEPEKSIFADITIRQHEAEGVASPTDADHKKLQEKYRKLQNKIGSHAEMVHRLEKVGLILNSESQNSGQENVNNHESRDSKAWTKASGIE